jgi:hypothetical protein
MAVIPAPGDEANAGTSRAAERRRRPRFGFHPIAVSTGAG